MKNIFMNIRSASSFSNHIHLAKKSYSSLAKLPLLLCIDCDSCEFITVYEYDSRSTWDFCTKICIKSYKV